MKRERRFSYIKYDIISNTKQEAFKKMFEAIENFAEETLSEGRYKSLLMTSLEEAYMWTGKAIRDEQLESEQAVNFGIGNPRESKPVNLERSQG